MKIKIGVLAIQGGFSEHITALKNCSRLTNYLNNDIIINTVELRSQYNLTEDIDGIILPGGESTAMGRLLAKDDFGKYVTDYVNGNHGNNKPFVWGTCSGLIILADQIENQKAGGQFHLGGLDVTVSRNYFGRQLNSFEATVKLSDKHFHGTDTSHGVFIRAPAIISSDSPQVEILGTIIHNDENITVAAQQDNILATAFHPELTEELLWHIHFIDLIVQSKKKNVINEN